MVQFTLKGNQFSGFTNLLKCSTRILNKIVMLLHLKYHMVIKLF